MPASTNLFLWLAGIIMLTLMYVYIHMHTIFPNLFHAQAPPSSTDFSDEEGCEHKEEEACPAASGAGDYV